MVQSTARLPPSEAVVRRRSPSVILQEGKQLIFARPPPPSSVQPSIYPSAQSVSRWATQCPRQIIKREQRRFFRSKEDISRSVSEKKCTRTGAERC